MVIVGVFESQIRNIEMSIVDMYISIYIFMYTHRFKKKLFFIFH